MIFFFQVKEAYVSFLNHCYIDTEVEMKEIYATNYMWNLFERSFIKDMNHITSNAYQMSRTDADIALEAYVTSTVMMLINTFFNSPFSDQSSSLQVSVSTIIGCMVKLTLVFLNVRSCSWDLISFSLYHLPTNFYTRT